MKTRHRYEDDNVRRRVTQQGFELDIGFIVHFNPQLVITLNYSVITNFYTLQFARGHGLFQPAVSSLVAAW
jgi:hypothetical protein